MNKLRTWLLISHILATPLLADNGLADDLDWANDNSEYKSLLNDVLPVDAGLSQLGHLDSNQLAEPMSPSVIQTENDSCRDSTAVYFLTGIVLTGLALVSIRNLLESKLKDEV